MYKLPMPAVTTGHKTNASSTAVEVKFNTGLMSNEQPSTSF